MLMHTDAYMLMHADDYWCIRYVDDVFLEPHLQIIYIDFIYFNLHYIYILYADSILMHADAC